MANQVWNIWYHIEKRWIRTLFYGIGFQNSPENPPFKLALEQCLKQVKDEELDPYAFQIRELIGTDQPGHFYDPKVHNNATPNPIPITSGPAINNHTCPTCKNNRCSLNELICWKCGNKL